MNTKKLSEADKQLIDLVKRWWNILYDDKMTDKNADLFISECLKCNIDPNLALNTITAAAKNKSLKDKDGR